MCCCSSGTSTLTAFMSCDLPMDTNSLTVCLPLGDLLALYRAIENNNNQDTQLERLRREVEGLRNMQYECMTAIGDLRKSLIIK